MQKGIVARALICYWSVLKALSPLALITLILSYSPVDLTQEKITLLPQHTSEPVGTNTDSV